MSTSKYPFLFATLGEAAARLPEDLASTLEDTFTATQTPGTPRQRANSITVLNCLRRIREVEAADGQPWPRKGHTPGQRMALARIDRANAGQTFLLELLHAVERTRVDGEADEQVSDGAREGLLFACRALVEYMDVQLHAA